MWTVSVLVFSLRPLFLFSSLEISQVFFSSRFFRSPNPKKERNSHTMPPAPVPETALKKRRRDEEWAAARASAAAEARSKRAASRADAIKRAGSTEANAVREALVKSNYKGILGPITFDANQQSHNNLMLMTVNNGSLVVKELVSGK